MSRRKLLTNVTIKPVKSTKEQPDANLLSLGMRDAGGYTVEYVCIPHNARMIAEHILKTCDVIEDPNTKNKTPGVIAGAVLTGDNAT